MKNQFFNQLYQKAVATLTESASKVTPQRLAVIRALSEHYGQHLSCEELLEYVQKKHDDVGLATIYRTVTLFEKLGIVGKIDFDDGFSRYELSENDNSHGHHHLICIVCGEITDARKDLLENLENEIQNSTGFLVKNHSVKFYGVCNKCR